MPSWTAEIEVDADLVTRLLTAFPALAGIPVRRLSEGWDRSVWLVGDTWVFGFPRRAVVLPGMAREVAHLPRLAALLPVPVPVPELLGSPAGGFPWPYWGARFLPGAESCAAGLDAAGRRAVGTALAGFLRRLHSRAVAAEVDGIAGPAALPVDPNGRADMARRVPLALRQLAELRADGLWDPPPAAAAVLDAAGALPASAGADPATLPVVHGDLHFRHLLVEGAGPTARLTGVIDWVDLCRADPAVDLQAYWSFVEPEDRPAFRAAYGPVGDDSLLRARALALSLNAALAAYGHAAGMPEVKAAALAALERTVAG